jgi:hypothetical protein
MPHTNDKHAKSNKVDSLVLLAVGIYSRRENVGIHVGHEYGLINQARASTRKGGRKTGAKCGNSDSSSPGLESNNGDGGSRGPFLQRGKRGFRSRKCVPTDEIDRYRFFFSVNGVVLVIVAGIHGLQCGEEKKVRCPTRLSDNYPQLCICLHLVSHKSSRTRYENHAGSPEECTVSVEHIDKILGKATTMCKKCLRSKPPAWMKQHSTLTLAGCHIAGLSGCLFQKKKFLGMIVQKIIKDSNYSSSL